jgi:hypothetical protein
MRSNRGTAKVNTLNYTPKDPAIAAELERRIAQLDDLVEDEALALVKNVVLDVFNASVSLNERDGLKLADTDRAELMGLVKKEVIESAALGDAMRKLLQTRQEVAVTMTSQAIVADARARGRT